MAQETTYTANIPFISSDTTLAGPALGDLWLPVFGGEILSRFNEYLTMADKVRGAVISDGNTANFPSLGQLDSETHNRGDMLLGMDSSQTERVLTLEDRPVVSHFETDDMEKMLTHFGGRMELATEVGRALARQWDSKVSMLISQAAEEAAPTADAANFPGGGLTGVGDSIIDTATATANEAGALAMLGAAQQAAVRFDEVYVPLEDRYMAVTPAMWYALKNLGVPSATAFNSKAYFGDKNFASTDGQIDPSVATGAETASSDYLLHNGIKIFRSISIPTTDITAGIDAKYFDNYSNTRALIFQRQAVGAVTKMGIATESYRDVRRQSDFFVGKVYTGGGTLRPQCAIRVANIVTP
jgi:hypothetical protein